MDDTARQIRQRIIWIILRAFISVILVSMLLIMVLNGIAISNSLAISPIMRLPIFARLEGYYVGHGSWEGVQDVLATENTSSAITLLDMDGRVVIDHGNSAAANLGLPYQATAYDILVDLKVDGQVIGSLVFDRKAAPSQMGAVTTILLPASLLAVFLVLLATVLIALFLRRVVTPLAEVIAASRAVTAGKLDARVQVQGPQDLRLLIDSFNQMTASLERNDRERRDLLTDIAHELRTPISAIRGRLEGMVDGVYPIDQQHISLALKANYLLERLVEDLRLLTLAESGQLRFEKRPTDLKALAARSLEMFSAAAQEQNIQLQLLPAAGDFIVALDPQRTEQVLGNLLGNALQYVPSGGKVWLALETNDGAITLSVCDNGPGIPEADLPHVFDRFWRQDKSRTRHTGGSGLGLAIARQFVEAQGGTISVENLAEGGLKVTLHWA